MRTLLIAHALHLCPKSDQPPGRNCETSFPDTVVPWYKEVQIQESCQPSLCLQGLRLGAHSSCEQPPVAQIHESTYQNRPSFVPKECCTSLILSPEGPRALCCRFQPRPAVSSWKRRTCPTLDPNPPCSIPPPSLHTFIHSAHQHTLLP